MKYSHWELLLSIYQHQHKGDLGFKPYKLQCHKTLINTCIRNGWVKENDDGTVEVTQKGEDDAAKEFTQLYEENFVSMGRTF